MYLKKSKFTYYVYSMFMIRVYSVFENVDIHFSDKHDMDFKKHRKQSNHRVNPYHVKLHSVALLCSYCGFTM